MHARIAAFIEQHDLLAPGETVLVGASGGLDSTVLVHVLHRLGYAVELAHVNYGLRGAASEGDAAFVRELGSRLGLPVHEARCDAKKDAAERQTSVQDAARRLRYAFFAETATARTIRAVAVAHHLDDQVETVLLALLRGRGPEGVAGMAPQRPMHEAPQVQLIRPMLQMQRQELEQWANAQGITWRVDASNADERYRRNAIRHRLVPVLEAVGGPEALVNIARSSGLLRAYLDADMQPSLDVLFAAAVTREGASPALRLEVLQALDPVWQGRLLMEALRQWVPDADPDQAQVAQLVALIAKQAGKHVVLGETRVWREREALVFVPPREAAAHQQQVLRPGETARLPHGMLHFDLLAVPPQSLNARNPRVAYLDAEMLQNAVVVRPWREGDCLQPLGMAGTKRASDLLTEAQVPVHRRHDVWVVEAAGTIVWVVGHRLAEAAKVHAGTAQVAKFTFLPSEST